MSFTKRGVIANNDIDSIEDVAVIEVEGMKYLWIAFVVGVANLSAFTVDGKVLDTGDWFPLAAASGDYTSPVHPVLRASSNLAAAAFGSTVHFLKLDVSGLHSVRLRAAGTSSTILGSFGLG